MAAATSVDKRLFQASAPAGQRPKLHLCFFVPDVIAASNRAGELHLLTCASTRLLPSGIGLEATSDVTMGCRGGSKHSQPLATQACIALVTPHPDCQCSWCRLGQQLFAVVRSAPSSTQPGHSTCQRTFRTLLWVKDDSQLSERAQRKCGAGQPASPVCQQLRLLRVSCPCCLLQLPQSVGGSGEPGTVGCRDFWTSSITNVLHCRVHPQSDYFARKLWTGSCS